jgi:hypothetical protein
MSITFGTKSLMVFLPQIFSPLLLTFLKNVYYYLDIVGYDLDSSNHNGISTKKLAILFGLSIIGAIIFIQILFGFPLANLIRGEVTEEAKVVIKSQGKCIVNTSDHPRSIPNCRYNVGDTLIVTYKNGTEPIEKYDLKNS